MGARPYDHGDCSWDARSTIEPGTRAAPSPAAADRRDRRRWEAVLVALAAGVTVLLLAVSAMSASAAPQPLECEGTRAEMTAKLESKHGERQRDWRLGPGGVLWEFWVASKVSGSKGRSWSLLSVHPNGMTCIVTHGWGAVLPAEERL